MATRTAWLSAVVSALLVASPARATAQTGGNVLLVQNDTSAVSVIVAGYYAKVRSVPASNIVRLTTTDADSIGRSAYESTIEGPIALWLAKNRLQDQILYIVLTKGVPLRIEGTGGLSGSVSSVDSELTQLYRKTIGATIVTAGRVDNSYYLGDKPISQAARFSRRVSDLYLVTRLDGFSIDDVKKLIDRGASPVTDGAIVLDQRAVAAGDAGGDRWLAQAAERLTSMNHGARVQLETTRAVAALSQPVLGYFSWGSNDPANRLRQVGMRFANGAIGGTFVSTDGRTFREPPADWKPGAAGGASGGQSLAGDLIREGITGTSAHVAEPFLDAVVRPQILFPAYLSGFNLADSYYLAMPYLSWQNIVIGDPLCAPFGTAPLAASEIHDGISADTDLPALFSARRLATLSALNLNTDALKLMLRAQALSAQGRPEAEVHEFLKKATTLEPRLTGPQMDLAIAAELRREYDDAITRYRAVIAVEPNNVMALNNLAYTLADRRDAAREALPFAERAYQLSGQAGGVADTLGWVHYKLGNPSAAVPYLDRAARLEPQSADILVHAATAHADLKNLAQARAYLDAALKADPAAASREDVKALAARIR